jgi:hypothetical protein
MLRRICFSVLAAMFFAIVVCPLHAQHKVLAKLRFHTHNRAEKTAGVWVDGQYVGYVKELNGDKNKNLLLLPGKHEVVVRQPWYKDYIEEVVLEPGEVRTIKLLLVKDGRTLPAPATGELKISATPERAVVFVDDQFAGPVNEFDGLGKAMLLTPGPHRVRIALPGYLPFETTVDLRPRQKLKIQTALVKGSITEAGSLVSQK